ncbi:hypothetical protein CTM62_06030 [Prevotella intermedia]|uniref:Uncharacterized protein n=1 Tax=Prevotella intermedia TaxID=28131 RepID=A0A2D3L6W2_PREIN|nr:hypothetical protein CTM62_06030 [Prevotella intermedia]
MRLLSGSFCCEKYLQGFWLFSTHKIWYFLKATLFVNSSFSSARVTLYGYLRMACYCSCQQ